MEKKINKLLPIIGTGIAFEAFIFVLYIYTKDEQRSFVYLFISFITIYLLMLFFAKRYGILKKTGFLQSFLYALLIATPVILLSPVIGLFYRSIIAQELPNLDWVNWIGLMKALSFFSIIKFILAFIIAFVFCTRLESVIGISAEKELQLYGTTTEGTIFHKRQHRHVWLVKAEYFYSGRRYETKSIIDRKNTVSQNDTVTVIYSTKNPYLSNIKELTKQSIS